MKSLFVLVALVALPLIAVAGPEDRQFATCFKATSVVPNSLQSTVCLDSAQLTNDNSHLELSGYIDGLPSNLEVKSLITLSENKHQFIAEATLINIWETGCGYGELAIVKIIGISEKGTQYAEINPSKLNISIAYSSTNDTCHSRPMSQTFNYKSLR